jgi:hypothetical protein
MSIEVQNAVWRESASTGRARLVLLAIADHQGEIGAWPSIATLAEMANASERSVQRDIAELVESGELIKLEQQAPSRGQYKSNLYWVNLPSVAHLISGVTNTVSGVTELQSGVTESAPGVTAGGVLTITKPLLKPLLKDIQQIEAEFDEFWSIYPNRKEKTAAKKAFVKAREKTDADTILNGARRYLNDPNRDPAFTKHPATWLNGGCWDDDPIPAKLSKATKREAEAKQAGDNFVRMFTQSETKEIESDINWGEIL